MSTFLLLAVIYGLLVYVGYLGPLAYESLTGIRRAHERVFLVATAIIFTLPVVFVFFATPSDRAFVKRSLLELLRTARATLRHGFTRTKAVATLYDRFRCWG